MHYVVVAYLCLALLLYLVLGGADFGAGIIELFTPHRHRRVARQTMYHAIGPIWEANHMWLIIAVVILFVAFPRIYSVMSVSLHIPLVIMLLGIIARGTAFVFRSYDAVKDNMQGVYSRIFTYSSFVTPLFLGIIAASVLSGTINLQATTFLDAYVFSWLHWFSVAVGFFTVALCGYLASVYLIGEATDEINRQRYIAKTMRLNIIAVACGALVFAAAHFQGVPLLNWIFGNAVGVTAVVLATLSLGLQWYLLLHGHDIIPRLLAGFQATMILLAIGYKHFPDFIILRGGGTLSLFTQNAPESTMHALGLALLLGSVLILPALGYLYYSFQKKEEFAEH
ncbi:cytochrome d ubiquinol oxidase subunit II [Hymenobacter sp. BT491]|uniref:cytochrome d ubiquinol oxidase subunit II n=1 Tax=Hymenobacter sp. BT491 TaxID=2766779 RepID=UPI0016534769|nr:cytochrome d ubiquinol oxidase subunit II [Hymenobacter sp. BT491]MBC6989130.1 cytochrome d ubiquinol oxidase subunit II [Hymenobacter sp. BT491]